MAKTAKQIMLLTRSLVGMVSAAWRACSLVNSILIYCRIRIMNGKFFGALSQRGKTRQGADKPVLQS
jgi:hypothetical protein